MTIDFQPEDFTYWHTLEKRIYKNYSNEITDKTIKYIEAHLPDGGVRMVFIQLFESIDSNKLIKNIYYCTDNKDNAIIPKLIENKDGDDVLDKKCSVSIMYDKSLDFFMENLGETDIIRTHKHAIMPNEKTDAEIYQILTSYLI